VNPHLAAAAPTSETNGASRSPRWRFPLLDPSCYEQEWRAGHLGEHQGLAVGVRRVIAWRAFSPEGNDNIGNRGQKGA